MIILFAEEVSVIFFSSFRFNIFFNWFKPPTYYLIIFVNRKRRRRRNAGRDENSAYFNIIES